MQDPIELLAHGPVEFSDDRLDRAARAVRRPLLIGQHQPRQSAPAMRLAADPPSLMSREPEWRRAPADRRKQGPRWVLLSSSVHLSSGNRGALSDNGAPACRDMVACDCSETTDAIDGDASVIDLDRIGTHGQA